MIAESKADLKLGEAVYLRMHINKAELDFAYSLDGEQYILLIENADARF